MSDIDPKTTTSVLDELVGPGKKFATVEDLAKGKLEADTFIDKLKDENRQFVEELETMTKKVEEGSTVSELLKEFREKSSQGGDNQNLTEEALREYITKFLEGREETQTRDSNRDKGNKLVLGLVNGDEEAAKKYITDRAKELRMSEASLVELSETSPEAFARLVTDVTSTVPGSILDIPGRQNSLHAPAGVQMEIDGYRTKAWYDKQRKEMGNLKFLKNHSLQNQMLKDAQALRERFYN